MATPANLVDPRPGAFVGLSVSFTHQGKRLVGIVESQRFIGLTVRGQIPDWSLVVRGSSGARVTVSLVEAHTNFRGID